MKITFGTKIVGRPPRPVMSPLGAFHSLTAAAKATGTWYSLAWRWAQKGSQGYNTGWYWL